MDNYEQKLCYGRCLCMYVLHIRGEWGYIYFGYNVIVCKFCGFFLKPLRNRKDDSCVSKYYLCWCVLIFVLVCVDIGSVHCIWYVRVFCFCRCIKYKCCGILHFINRWPIGSSSQSVLCQPLSICWGVLERKLCVKTILHNKRNVTNNLTYRFAVLFMDGSVTTLTLTLTLTC